MPERSTYDVALSFADEARPYVHPIAEELRRRKVRVFYDRYETVAAWGKDLKPFLGDVFYQRSTYVVVFVSKKYASNEWTKHELRSALARAAKERREYILPVRIDNTRLRGLSNTIGYLDIRKYDARSIADHIALKLKTNSHLEPSEIVEAEPDTPVKPGKYFPLAIKPMAARRQGSVWQAPFYNIKTRTGRLVEIDVTSSAAHLPPNRALQEFVIPLFRREGVRRVIDCGAGSLRHTLALLQAGFDVCAVEFEHSFGRNLAAEALGKAKRFPGFSILRPDEFLRTSAQFDAALLCYVLQIMPIPKERHLVIHALRTKLGGRSYLLYAGTCNRFSGSYFATKAQRVSDGYFLWGHRNIQTFYREFSSRETDRMFRRVGFEKVNSLSRRRAEQVFLYRTEGNAVLSATGAATRPR